MQREPRAHHAPASNCSGHTEPSKGSKQQFAVGSVALLEQVLQVGDIVEDCQMSWEPTDETTRLHRAIMEKSKKNRSLHANFLSAKDGTLR